MGHNYVIIISVMLTTQGDALIIRYSRLSARALYSTISII